MFLKNGFLQNTQLLLNCRQWKTMRFAARWCSYQQELMGHANQPNHDPLAQLTENIGV